ncbi:hypothetical protein OAT67_08535 [Bacteriovoracaceae bacterium]|nr:hypothetical protein [Bacteriovoracaceae bacterium]
MEISLDTNQKAFEINLDAKIYGTFAEIGAGQEVARHFFRAGGAAGTIAKSMSAYDMAVSDAIYGKSGRYVSHDRLLTMLDHEYRQLKERLHESKGKDSRFFVFADTVAAKSFNYNAECHGWLGVRFQGECCGSHSEVIIHVRMLDNSNLQQQEALGIIGVNLIYAAFNSAGKRESFISQLMDGLSLDRIRIDYIHVSGPAFKETDSRLWPLELVKKSFCSAILFDHDGSVLQPKDALYKKNILICRGSYRPPTLVNIDMIKMGVEQFKKDSKEKEVLVLPEISMNKLKERGVVESEDFLARVDLLCKLGYQVLISSFETFGDLNQYIKSCTNGQTAFVLGYYNLQEVFDIKNYEQVKGGVLGGIGHLTSGETKLYLYPAKNEDDDSILDSSKAELPNDLGHILSYLQSSGKIVDLKKFNKNAFHIWSRVVIKMIQNGESGWEEMVPDTVAKAVKEKCLFDYPCDT